VRSPCLRVSVAITAGPQCAATYNDQVGVGWDEIRAAVAARPGAQVPDAVGSRAAVAVVLRDAAGGLEMLFIRRAEHPQDPWSGQMAFPGGRAEPGDADLRATAVRETREETGIDLEAQAELIGPLDELRAMARLRPVDLAITPFVFRLQRDVTPVLSDEVRSLHWLPFEELLRPDLRSTMEYTHRDVVLEFPCLRVQDLVIWGLTYRMFLGLLERLGLTPGEAAPLAAAAASAATGATPPGGAALPADGGRGR
jgi:8-oxo-dGTP pyrophosphatase MutT (NUDIX family)